MSGGDEVGRPHTYYYHPDHLGSTSWVTDEAGRVREHVLYFPYGSVWRDAKNDAEGAPPRTQAFLFTGKEYDQETGYYYFGARYYDPQVARWLGVDAVPFGPATRALKLSLYAYVGWSPIRYSDPTGLDKEQAIGGGFEAAGGMYVKLLGASYAMMSLPGILAYDYLFAKNAHTVATAPTSSDAYANASTFFYSLNPFFDAVVGLQTGVDAALQLKLTPPKLWTESMGGNLVSGLGQYGLGVLGTAGVAGLGASGLYKMATGPADSIKLEMPPLWEGISGQSVEDFIANPDLLRGLSPEDVKSRLGGRIPEGWREETLGRGTHKGQGWVLREYGDNGKPTGRQLRWHPGGGHHGPDPYWRANGYNSKSGIIR